MASVVLKSGRDYSVRQRHPWIFSGAVARVDGAPEPGATVDVVAADGTRLGRGAYSPQSQIVVRLWTFAADEEIGPAFFQGRLARALAVRQPLADAGVTTAYRLVYGESDGLPGVIADRYGDYLVCQFLTAGAERWKRDIARLLAERLSPRGVYERSDVEVRQKEGLDLVKGSLLGEAPPDLVEVQESACRFLVDVQRGHKTGFYLDQRENRAGTGEYCHGRDVLNCFSYTGGFGIWALKGGAARVTNVDLSAAALDLGRRNVALNDLAAEAAEDIEGDVFAVLRQFRDSRRQFDVIVLDPPKFVESKGHVEKGARGYKDINLLAFKLLRPGGILVTFSCSGLVGADLFQKIVADAALDAGREAQILRRLAQPLDHPTALSFPESAYLKGLVCRAVD